MTTAQLLLKCFSLQLNSEHSNIIQVQIEKISCQVLGKEVRLVSGAAIAILLCSLLASVVDHG